MRIDRRTRGACPPAMLLLWLQLSACADREQHVEDKSDPVQPSDGGVPHTPARIEDAKEPEEDPVLAEQPFERLLIADGIAPVAYVVDAASHQTLASFGLGAVARVYRGALGRYGFAVQAEANQIQIFDSGLSIEDHGDHLHHERMAPGLLPHALKGARPVHFVGHGTQVAAFFDDDGVAHVVDERSLLMGAPHIVALDTTLPHHGVALAFGAGFLASTPELISPATRASPTGVAVYDASGTRTGQSFGSCAGLHGEAALDGVAAFGCSDGVLLVEAGNPYSARKISNPITSGSPAPRVGTLIAHPALHRFVGNFGADRLCVIEPDVDVLQLIEVPAPYLQFGFDAHGQHLLLLAKSGRLHILDAHDLTEVAVLNATHAPSDDGGHGAHSPQFAVGERHVYVTRPEQGKVVVVDMERLAIVHEIEVPGHPTKIAVLGAASDP